MSASRDTQQTASTCPYPLGSLFGYGRQDRDGNAKTTAPRQFPWVAFGGLGLVAMIILFIVYISFSLLVGYYYYLWVTIALPFKLGYVILGTFLKVALWPISFALALFRNPAVARLATPASLSCTNVMELQGWEILTLVPGQDGNPATVKYTLNSPTPHAVSIVDIDYRDTRIDVLSNGKYYGTTSDFTLNKTEFCGEDLNKCIALGFSTGTVIVPGGTQNVEVAWSGKDVFPGTDKIVWGGERKRRVMWKKDLCL